MTNYNPDMRFSSVSDVAAALTQMRSTLSDWKWDGPNAILETNGRVIELQKQNDGNFKAFQIKGGHSRRMQGVPVCSLSEILKMVKK